MVTIRLRQQTAELLEKLVESLPAHPVVGPQPRAMVLRAVVDAGIEAVAKREGIKLRTVAKTVPSKRAERPAEPRASKTSDGKTVHPNSRLRAEKRAAARLAAGCKCGHSHVRTCKLYRQSAA
jgi:hypothetical protein